MPIIRSWRPRDVIASCWYVPWLREGCQDRLAGSASIDGFVAHLSFSNAEDPSHWTWSLKVQLASLTGSNREGYHSGSLESAGMVVWFIGRTGSCKSCITIHIVVSLACIITWFDVTQLKVWLIEKFWKHSWIQRPKIYEKQTFFFTGQNLCWRV